MTFYSLETCEIFLKKIKNYSAKLYFKFGLRSEEHLECFNPEIFSFAVTGSRPYISSVKCPACEIPSGVLRRIMRENISTSFVDIHLSTTRVSHKCLQCSI